MRGEERSGAERAAPQASAAAYYEDRLRRFGPTARGMDWRDEQSQRLRFRVLCEVCDLSGRSVHELGAGAGHLHGYLRECGVHAAYSGSDVSTAMVESARRLHPGVAFEQRDWLADPPGEAWDVVLASGVFHVKLHYDEATWGAYVRALLERMYAACRAAIAFNLMSDLVDFRSDTLYHANPGETLDFCRNALSRYVALRHDYPLHEYTVYVYRDPSVARAGTSGPHAPHARPERGGGPGEGGA